MRLTAALAPQLRNSWYAHDNEPRTQPGIQIMIAKCFTKCRKSRRTGAMARSDVIDLPGVVQAGYRPGDIGIVRCDKVETTDDQMYTMIDRRSRLHDILDSRHLIRWPRELQLAQEGSESHIANQAMQHVIGLKAHQPAGALGE
jgi:hypothetical protein